VTAADTRWPRHQYQTSGVDIDIQGVAGVCQKQTRYSILQKADYFSSECTDSFVIGFRPDPLGSLQSPPDPGAAFDRPTSKREEGRGQGRGQNIMFKGGLSPGHGERGSGSL